MTPFEGESTIQDQAQRYTSLPTTCSLQPRDGTIGLVKRGHYIHPDD
jgi:hypothetical protein